MLSKMHICWCQYLLTLNLNPFKYVPGNFNMIITAPHGGYIDVPNCPLCNFGCFINGKCQYDSSSSCTPNPDKCDIAAGRDFYTQEIARLVVQSITMLKQKTPHLVIMKCSRLLYNLSILLYS